MLSYWQKSVPVQTQRRIKSWQRTPNFFSDRSLVSPGPHFAIMTHEDSQGWKPSTVNATRADMGLQLEHRIVSAIFILDTTFHHFLFAYHPFSGHLTRSRSWGKPAMQPRHPPPPPRPSAPGVPNVSQDFVRSEGTHNPFNVSSGVFYLFGHVQKTSTLWYPESQLAPFGSFPSLSRKYNSSWCVSGCSRTSKDGNTFQPPVSTIVFLPPVRAQDKKVSAGT